MSSIFVTGFPGFLGTELVERLLGRYASGVFVHCLIQPRYRNLAMARIAEIEANNPTVAGRICLHEGDISEPDLGLGRAYQTLVQTTTEIYHLAAVYDLGVDQDLATAINLNGTRHLLRLAERCTPRLARFHHVSTCYVSGRYPGVFEEEDLDKGQSFNNYYEETKYLAEIEVQAGMAHGLPGTIYRPSIVVGDSQTGATQKYDGIYFFLQWLLRQPPIAVMPIIGDPTRYDVNFVPRDFVVEAMHYLSGLETSRGKVYQLCDPRPLLVDQIIDLLGEITGRKIVRIPLPKVITKGSIEYVPLMERFTRIEPATIDYFTHPTHYTCDNVLADLEGSGISCPPFESYVKNLIDFMKTHPDIPARAMV